MTKRMFVVMEVKDVDGYPEWVRPINVKYNCAEMNEWIRKRRVIYADEKITHDYPGGEKRVLFFGVSPSNEEDELNEFEKWAYNVADTLGLPTIQRNNFANMLLRMPREKNET